MNDPSLLAISKTFESLFKPIFFNFIKRFFNKNIFVLEIQFPINNF